MLAAEERTSPTQWHVVERDGVHHSNERCPGIHQVRPFHRQQVGRVCHDPAHTVRAPVSACRGRRRVVARGGGCCRPLQFDEVIGWQPRLTGARRVLHAHLALAQVALDVPRSRLAALTPSTLHPAAVPPAIALVALRHALLVWPSVHDVGAPAHHSTPEHVADLYPLGISGFVPDALEGAADAHSPHQPLRAVAMFVGCVRGQLGQPIVLLLAALLQLVGHAGCLDLVAPQRTAQLTRVDAQPVRLRSYVRRYLAAAQAPPYGVGADATLTFVF